MPEAARSTHLRRFRFAMPAEIDVSFFQEHEPVLDPAQLRAPKIGEFDGIHASRGGDRNVAFLLAVSVAAGPS